MKLICVLQLKEKSKNQFNQNHKMCLSHQIKINGSTSFESNLLSVIKLIKNDYKLTFEENNCDNDYEEQRTKDKFPLFPVI